MINTVEGLRLALNRGEYRGVVLYDGPSRIDGAPIIAIACRITEASENGKTGAMVQTFIMRRDIPPHTALKTGDDASVCGDCARVMSVLALKASSRVAVATVSRSRRTPTRGYVRDMPTRFRGPWARPVW